MKVRMKIYLITFFLLSTLLLSITKVNAQVTIGSTILPVNGSLLDLKEEEKTLDPADRLTFENATKGVMMPRVKLIKFDDISVLGITTDEDKLKATGMVVYNINPNADGIIEGLVSWTGEEWQPMGGSGVSQSAVEDPDLDKITIEGTYVAGRPLKMSENIMLIPLNVIRKGSYKITAEAIQDDANRLANGYVFVATGEFAAAGETVVVLTGQGVPTKSSKDIGEAAGTGDLDDIFDIYINGKLFSASSSANTVTNKVLKIPPVYSFSCSSVQTNGSYKIKQVTNSTNTITMRISASDAGGEYYIYTDEINGIRFEASGTLVKGTQQVILQASGTPESGGRFDYQIYSNSTMSTSACAATVNVSYPEFKIMVCGSTGDAWSLVAPASSLAMVTKNSALFGLTGGANPDLNAPVSVDMISILPYTTEPTSNRIAADNPNIIFISYNVRPDAASVEALYDFVVNKKGFLIYSVEENAALARIATKFDSFITVTGEDNGPNMMPLNGGNSLVNGLYRNLSGLTIGRDGSGNQYFSHYEANWDVIAMGGSGPRMIVHKTHPVVLCGDGGIFAGGYNYGTGTAYFRPARVDSNGNPVDTTADSYTGACNSSLLVNLIMWAIDQTNR